jgi:hypothetical protein
MCTLLNPFAQLQYPVGPDLDIFSLVFINLYMRFFDPFVPMHALLGLLYIIATFWSLISSPLYFLQLLTIFILHLAFSTSW